MSFTSSCSRAMVPKSVISKSSLSQVSRHGACSTLTLLEIRCLAATTDSVSDQMRSFRRAFSSAAGSAVAGHHPNLRSVRGRITYKEWSSSKFRAVSYKRREIFYDPLKAHMVKGENSKWKSIGKLRFISQCILSSTPSERAALRDGAMDAFYAVNWKAIGIFLAKLVAAYGVSVGVVLVFLKYIKHNSKRYTSENRFTEMKSSVVPCASPDNIYVNPNRDEKGSAELRQMVAAFADDFRRAQQHMFPVDLKLLMARATGATISEKDFCYEFKGAKRLEKTREKFGRRFTPEANAIDIGMKMNPSERFEEAIYRSEVQLGVLESLHEHGFCLLRNALPRDLVEAMKLAIFEEKEVAFESAAMLGVKIAKEKDPNVWYGRHTVGRLFMILRGSSLEFTFEDFHKYWMPACYGYLLDEILHTEAVVDSGVESPEETAQQASAQSVAGKESCSPEESKNLSPEEIQRRAAKSTNVIVTKKSPETAKALNESFFDSYFKRETPENTAKTVPRLFCSEAQLVLSDNWCETQCWHADNAARGITVVVPLEDVHAASDRGIEVIPGSHRLLGTSGFGQYSEGYDGGGENKWFSGRLLDVFKKCCYAHGVVTVFDILAADEGRKEENLNKIEPHSSQRALLPNSQQNIETREDALVWKAGDVFVHDARLIKRFAGSDSLHRIAPYLILRYDRYHDPRAPNQGKTKMFLNQFSGKMFEKIFGLWGRV